MAYIGRQLVRGQNRVLDDISGSFNGSTTAFNLTVSSSSSPPASVNQLWIILGGILQKPGTDFTVADAVITFTTAPASTLSFWGMIQGDTSDINAPSDASVTPSKIANSGDFAFPADVRFKDADGSHYVGLQAPSTVSSNLVWTLPAADGSANYLLKTDGSGTLGWAADSTTDSTKMPLAGGTFTGDVTFDGATAGRDIVWDKSDNALEFADNAKGIFGTGADLEVYHDATDNQIKSTNGKVVITTTAGNSDIEITPNGSGNVKLDGLDWPNADGSANQYLKTDGSGALSWSTVTTTALTGSTNNTICTVTGANAIQGEANLTFDGTTLNITGDLDVSNDIKIADDGKILLGADSDLEIKHTGDTNYIWGNGANSPLTIGTNATSALSIDTSQKASFFGQIALSSGGAERLNISSPGAGDIAISNPTAAHLIFKTNNTEEVRILNGGGITFNGDTAAANALDDYEEGTFTPTCSGNSGSLTLSTAVGNYTKIGNVVYISYEIIASSGSTGTFPRLGGLPFTSSSSAAKTIISSKDKVGVSYGSSYSDMYFRLDQNATTAVGIAERIDGTTHTGSNLDFTGTLRGSGYYFV